MEKYYNAFKFHLESINPLRNSNIDICPIAFNIHIPNCFPFFYIWLFLHVFEISSTYLVYSLGPKIKDWAESGHEREERTAALSRQTNIISWYLLHYTPCFPAYYLAALLLWVEKVSFMY